MFDNEIDILYNGWYIINIDKEVREVWIKQYMMHMLVS